MYYVTKVLKRFVNNVVQAKGQSYSTRTHIFREFHHVIHKNSINFSILSHHIYIPLYITTLSLFFYSMSCSLYVLHRSLSYLQTCLRNYGVLCTVHFIIFFAIIRQTIFHILPLTYECISINEKECAMHFITRVKYYILHRYKMKLLVITNNFVLCCVHLRYYSNNYGTKDYAIRTKISIHIDIEFHTGKSNNKIELLQYSK